MFGKKKMVKITEEKYNWLLEKLQERQEYKKQAEIAKWDRDIAMRGLRMSANDWNLYHDFIKHRWYSLDEEAREQELALAEAMAKIERSEEGYMAFAQFIKQLHDVEFYSKQEEDL